MISHLRANLWLLGLTVVLCSVLYPLALLGLGQTVFRDKAEGSLVGADGKPVTDPAKAVGSRLIAQPFTGDEYFQPRPSAVSYKADASGASNWGASNYLLRERVAQALGPIVKYGRQGARPGQPVGPDVEAWLHDNPGAADGWAKAHPDAPGRWLKADKANAALVASWKKEENKDGEPAPEDVVPFFRGRAGKPPAEWPAELHAAVQAVFFESWRKAHPDADLEPVPADMVTTSGSGLDPHITLDNANYQLDRVVTAWAKKKTPGWDDKSKQEQDRIRGPIKETITNLLNEKKEAPLGGLAGVKLVNVLEVNLALRGRYAPENPAGQ
jgi:K+-transporting ATPase ATPase C chain